MFLKVKKLIIAHRGASFYEKENTIRAFKKAIDLHADFIEIDVRQTKDNILIAFHDSRIKKKKVRRIYYKDLLNISKFKIPTLEESLITINGKSGVMLDLKEKGYEKEIIKLLLKYLREKDFIIASSNLASLKMIKSENKKIKTGFIFSKFNIKDSLDLLQIRLFLKSSVKKYEIDYIFPNKIFSRKKFIKKARKLGIPLFFWTVNNRKKAESLLREKAVKGIITDKPDLLG